MFVSIDAWHGAAFDRLAEAMLAALPRPLHTVVEEADLDLTIQWQRAGFTTRRREWEYAVPTDPRATGLDSALPPPGVTIKAFGSAQEAPLRALDSTIRDEVAAGGIARALLAHALGALHHIGKETASAEVTESNVAATALFEGIGARRIGSNLELALR
jgi:hypothetical protein